MTRRRAATLLWIALCFAAVVTGCAIKKLSVGATVTAASTCGGNAAPVEGAAVSVVCAPAIQPSIPSLLGATDARGELAFLARGRGEWIHMNCELVIEKSGFREKRSRVADVCVEYRDEQCVHAVVTAQLVRAEAPPCP